MFLEQSSENRLVRIQEKTDILRRILTYLIKPLWTADWWEKTLSLVEDIVKNTHCYILRFNTTGEIDDVLKYFLRHPG